MGLRGFAAVCVCACIATACGIQTASKMGDDMPDPLCGNGALDPGEVCDDGNTASGDGCSASCTSDETCGNGVVDPVTGEVCDDGNTTDGDGCSADCKSDETCGNGVVDTAAGETCDDGGLTPADGCDANCQFEVRVYQVADIADLVNQGFDCSDGTNRYNRTATTSCNDQPFGFAWDDTTPFTPGTIQVEFNGGINCTAGADVERATALNNTAVGSVLMTTSGNTACICTPPEVVYTTTIDAAAYVVGGRNTFTIGGTPLACIGLSFDPALGGYARITVMP